MRRPLLAAYRAPPRSVCPWAAHTGQRHATTPPPSPARDEDKRMKGWGFFWLSLLAGLSTPRRESGVDDGTRTHDNRNHNPGLYQLSYAHHDNIHIRARQRARIIPRRMARPAGLEPATLGLEGRCSIQMSYGRRQLRLDARRPCPNARRLCIPRGTTSSHTKVVGVEGFEPTTSCSQSRRATSLRYTPTSIRTRSTRL